jgi:putative lipoic acid-binding regulatory protein
MVDDSHARAIKLLEETHDFPADYPLSVIVMNDAVVVTAVKVAVETDIVAGGVTCDTVASRGAKYLSLRFMVRCADAEAVLALHARVRVVPGVVRVL